MQREIKFRAWHKRDKIWLNHADWWFLTPTGNVAFKPHVVGNHNMVFPPIDLYELSQFTGLRDKDGKEIYEGDIIKTERGNSEVYFNHGAFVITYPDRKNWKLLNRGSKGSCEVLGNVFENPELISTSSPSGSGDGA